MIRIKTTRQELTGLINTLDPKWLAKAQVRTAKFKGLGKYKESSSIWSDVKEVYMVLQKGKCGYCERILATRDESKWTGKIEHDIEHYRPKNSVKSWPTKTIKKERKIDYPFETGEGLAGGYFLLAYHPLNYITSCKTCNSIYKGQFFPVAASRLPGRESPSDMKAERPFIPYPLGQDDDDPQDIITFVGPLPIPKATAQSSHAFRRAQVTIDFFRLDTREDLLRERAEVIRGVYMASRLADSGEAVDVADGLAHIKLSAHPWSWHSSCAIAYRRLYQANQPFAKEIYDLVTKYSVSQGNFDIAQAMSGFI